MSIIRARIDKIADRIPKGPRGVFGDGEIVAGLVGYIANDIISDYIPGMEVEAEIAERREVENGMEYDVVVSGMFECAAKLRSRIESIAGVINILTDKTEIRNIEKVKNRWVRDTWVITVFVPEESRFVVVKKE